MRDAGSRPAQLDDVELAALRAGFDIACSVYVQANTAYRAQRRERAAHVAVCEALGLERPHKRRTRYKYPAEVGTLFLELFKVALTERAKDPVGEIASRYDANRNQIVTAIRADRDAFVAHLAAMDPAKRLDEGGRDLLVIAETFPLPTTQRRPKAYGGGAMRASLRRMARAER